MKRYILNKNGSPIGEYNHITEVVKAVKCSRQHFYNTNNGGYFSYKGDEYRLIDKLSEYYIDDLLSKISSQVEESINKLG